VWTNVNAAGTLGAVLFRAGSLAVSSNSGFNADNAGYAGGLTNWFYHGFGPGGGYKGGTAQGGGGGNGGTGGLHYAAGPYGHPYGNATNANRHGSGGGLSGNSSRWLLPAGGGGGVIWIQSAGGVRMDGTLKADCVRVANYNGGGSGGGILVQAVGAFNGAPGALISARGGDGATYNTGGGAGGRVAVWQRMPEAVRDHIMAGNVSIKRYFTATSSPSYTGVVRVDGGTGTVAGGLGTVLFLSGKHSGALITIQ
jgi:hypothetical protein